MPAKDTWRSQFVPGTVRLERHPTRLVFDTKITSPETYNGRSMAGRIVEVTFTHAVLLDAYLTEFVHNVRESGTQLPDLLG